MKKPENKTTAKSKATPENAAAAPAGGKKPAASAPVIENSPVEAGAAEKAAASGGQVKPADSALLGKDKTPAAAAARKSDEAPTALASPQQDRLASVDKPQSPKPDTSAAKPAETPPAAAAAKPSTKTPQPAQKSGFLPLALGGVVAAGLGAAAAIWAMPYLPGGGQSAPALDAEALKQEIRAEMAAGNAALRDEAVAAARSELSAQIEALTAQAGEAGAEAARQIIAEMPAGADTTPELQAAVEAQSQQIVALTDRFAAFEAAGAGTAGGGIDPQQMTALQDQIRQTAAEAQAQLDAARAEAEKLQQAAESSTRRAEAVAAIAALQTALDEGGPTDAAVQQMEQAGVAAPEAVQQQVPGLLALQESYPPAARAALRAALRDGSAEADGGTMIGNFLRAQTGARSVEPREGTDADAVLSRAEAALSDGDVAAALTQLQALPEVAAQAPEMAAWLAGAQAHADARAALNDLSGQTN
ncbi:hypothetical protein FNJ84_02205 [Paracoccus sp. M683]|uniref:COG4223 family protein n=1 Tax=Paracoccus sp. M683 TaxID=2594268 RepID=UPI00117E36A0|nr:hypothetical protein [Paracoccus sp. M683]TRW99507.1 hypothetical protein FNJ84_02205 [Paracoccus sp. M683]